LAVFLLLHAAESERNAHLEVCGEDGLEGVRGRFVLDPMNDLIVEIFEE
jgi:hypothetical protein